MAREIFKTGDCEMDDKEHWNLIIVERQKLLKEDVV